ncbi:DNA polymerase theta isoform X2 [Eurosta solidaginis]
MEPPQKVCQNNSSISEDPAEVIQESPVHEPRSKHLGYATGMSMFSRSRTQRPLTRNNNTNCSSTMEDNGSRRLRKSKSDSTLPKHGVSNTAATADNYAELFRSGFTFSIEEDRQQSDTAIEASVLRVSQIVAAFEKISEEPIDIGGNVEDELGTGSISHDLDRHVCSEDLKGILENVRYMDPENGAFDDSYQNSDTSVLTIHNTNDMTKKEKTADEMEAHQLDQSRFICTNMNNAESQDQIINELEISRREISKENGVYKPNLSNKDKTAEYALKRMRTTFKQPTSIVVNKSIKDLESLKRISDWNLPRSILQEYEKKGVVKMFDWQIECLSNPKVLFEHCNLVYSAPTSAGKSLVSEILLLKTVLERGKKVLFILPFISVVREKMFYLQDLLTVAGYRVEGFFGGYTPPGGFDNMHVAICTIEKANSIVNKLLEQGKLSDIGTVVVDEVHLISDPGRGYILELLIAKLLYMSRKYGFQLQVVAMSATLANVELLKHWLDAELYITNFRPVALQEMIKIGNQIYDCKMRALRDITEPCQGNEQFPTFQNDPDHVAQLCIETLLEGCSVIIFCPSKDWCENLANQLANTIQALLSNNNNLGKRLRIQIKRESIEEVKKQLRDIPTGLDAVLDKTITSGCAFHHAGLTSEERDIIEASFKSCALKIIVATSTLSSGVNLPARRVLIRTPLFGGKQMSSLTYRQMIGRAGRTGKDTLGESILICTAANSRIGQKLMQADMKGINSCLEQESSTHLKRALLEVISSGVAVTKEDIENFVNCTLLSAEKLLSEQGKDKQTKEDRPFIADAVNFLIEYEFVRLQVDNETKRETYVATRLGQACLAASMPPTDGLILFAELQKSRRCFVLESELHAVYLVTPYSVCYQMQDLDWLLFLDMWEKLPPAMKKVGELVGVKESFLVRAMRGQSKLDYKLMQIHKRFYTALALQELVNEVPINKVAAKYKCTRGMLQGLQQMSSTFAGIVTAFCNSLQWPTLSLIVSQFKERLFFGIHRDLIDLMRLPDLSHKRARALFDAGIETLVDLANADVFDVEKVLYNALSFDSAKQHDNEADYEAEQRKQARDFFITGKLGLTVAEGAKLLVTEARTFVQYEIGVGGIKWTQDNAIANNSANDFHMSYEGDNNFHGIKRSSEPSLNEIKAEVTPPKIKKNNEQKFYEEKPSTSKEALRALKQRQLLPGTEQDHPALENPENVKDRSENSPAKSIKIPSSKNTEIRNDKNEKKPSRPTVYNFHETDPKNSNLKIAIQKEDNKENSKAKASDETKNILQNQQKVANLMQERNIMQKEKTSNADSNPVTEKNKHLRRESTESTNKVYDSHKTPKNSINSKQNAVFPQSTKGCTKLTTLAQNSSTKKSSSVNVEQDISAKQSTHSRKSSPKAAHGLQSALRRSPRNHQRNSNVASKYNATDFKPLPTTIALTTNENNQLDESIFMPDDSFELNTGINAALDSAKQSSTDPSTVPTHCKAMVDEIPESQQIVQAVADSPVPAKHSVHASRLLRTTQRLRGHKSSLSKKDASTHSPPTTSSIEVSDMSLENSLLKNPLQLNASHILNCSKTDTASTNFKRLELIDICGDQQLFDAALSELKEVKRFGFCLGLQQHENKRKPLIGGNLLINQKGARDEAHNETTVKDFQIDDNSYLAGCAFGITENIVYYMNMQMEGSCREVTTSKKCEFLLSLLRSKECTILCVDAKEQLKVLCHVLDEHNDVHIQLEDPKVANWLLQPDKFMSFQQMTQQFAPECTALTGLCGNGRGYGSHGLDNASAILAKVRCSVEACVTMHILKAQIENLERIGSGQLYKFFKDLEMPLQSSLFNMELTGFPANEAALRNLFQLMLETMKKLELKIYEMHGGRFNLGSSAAVAKVVGLHRKASGRISTSRQILEKIDSPISQAIIAYRKLGTTLSKNIQPLLKCVKMDRIHGQSITFTQTGRISMAEPNLQNVAKDFEVNFEGFQNINISCRSAFFPNESGRCLLSADFCQLEMRILAHLSQDAALLKVMNTDRDIFTVIAARWHKLAESAVSEMLRNGTKQICYGIVYGMGIRSLAEALKCTEQEATTLSQQFHLAYPGIRSYADKVVKFARNNGYIETITGRRRYLEHICSEEPQQKNQAERQAINSTIQGSAADIAKNAILRMEKNLEKYRNKLGLISTNAVRFVLHIHDELVFEVPSDKAKKVAKILSLTMENCVKISVPLKVKLKMGKSWGELQEIKL